MASWRDSASKTSQGDLDNLLNVVLPFAQEQLDERGGFFPFGAVISIEGETRLLGGYPGGERPPSQEVLQLLIDGAQSERDSLRAVAFVSDVRLTDPETDAVRVELEHREGPTLAVLLLYKKERQGRGVDYGSLMATPSQRKVWLP